MGYEKSGTMNKNNRIRIILHGLAVAFISVVLMCGCEGSSDSDSDSSSSETEPDAAVTGTGVATADYIEIAKIERVSRFRSGIGHDYSDPYESCRSMKHYFDPREYPVRIFSPVDGEIEYLREEWAGTQIGIRSGSRTFIIFHVTVSPPLVVGDVVAAGQQLGTHVGDQTMSDIAVREGDRYISYFETLDDAVFAEYQSRGVISRDTMIISQAERDRDPLECNGETFTTQGTIENWVNILRWL
jgi:hypothetical protein